MQTRQQNKLFRALPNARARERMAEWVKEWVENNPRFYADVAAGMDLGKGV